LVVIGRKYYAVLHIPHATMEVFQEGIGLVLSRWSVLRTAVENEWGGWNSLIKAQQFAADIFSWFTQSRGTINHLI
jgi:pre-rRNA-processing protein TSR2